MAGIDKVLITGADGFIGSHLTELMVSEGYQVRALTQYNSAGSWGWLEGSRCLPKIEVLQGDIRDACYCNDICAGMDAVLHLAALIAIPYSYIAPQSYLETNIAGTLNICQAARDKNVKRVIHTSTSEVYGTALCVPINEQHPLQAQSPYSASKIGADAIATSFHSSFGLPVTIARPFNTYGPRQSARAVIPTIIAQLASGVREIKLGSTSPTRDFNYVQDTCNGVISILRQDETVGKVINIGSGREISIGETFKIISEIMSVDARLVTDDDRLRPKNSEVFRLCADNTLIRKLTGWQPSHTLEEGLATTIDWIRIPENLSKYKHSIYNR